MNRTAPLDLTATVRQAAAGDQDAWNAIVAQYSRLLWSVVRGYRLGDAQSADVVQTTWLRLVEHLDSIRDPERLAAWLVTTARNASSEALRQSQRTRLMAEDFDAECPREGPDTTAVRAQQAQLVRDALRRLPVRDQQLFEALSADPPLPYEQISARLGMPIGSIGPTRMRALRRLRAELEGTGLLEDRRTVARSAS